MQQVLGQMYLSGDLLQLECMWLTNLLRHGQMANRRESPFTTYIDSYISTKGPGE